MLSQINDFMRNHCSPIHGVAKALASSWMKTDAPVLSAVRVLHGERVKLHPKFLTLNLDSVEPEVMFWIRRFVSGGSTVLDIGANIGLHTLYMAKLAGDSGRICAFEPAPPNLKLLRYHAKVNQLSQVQIVEKAVSDVDRGTVPFFLLNNGDHQSNSLTFGRDDVPNLDADLKKRSRVVQIETISVDRFCANENVRPNLIKIDVEGAELQVLRGAIQTLASLRPVLILAVHPWWLPPGQQVDDIVSFLAESGYVITNQKGEQTKILDYGEYLCEPLPLLS